MPLAATAEQTSGSHLTHVPTVWPIKIAKAKRVHVNPPMIARMSTSRAETCRGGVLGKGVLANIRYASD